MIIRGVNIFVVFGIFLLLCFVICLAVVSADKTSDYVSESDSGIDPFVKGSIIFDKNDSGKTTKILKEDSCIVKNERVGTKGDKNGLYYNAGSSTILREYFVKTTKRGRKIIGYKIFECENGCELGRCKDGKAYWYYYSKYLKNSACVPSICSANGDRFVMCEKKPSIFERKNVKQKALCVREYDNSNVGVVNLNLQKDFNEDENVFAIEEILNS